MKKKIPYSTPKTISFDFMNPDKDTGAIPRRKTILRRADGSIRVISHGDIPSATDLSKQQDQDINVVMARLGNPPVSQNIPEFHQQMLDMQDIAPKDLFESTLLVQAANRLFNELPSKLREKLDHDPHNLERYLSDPKNYDEAESYGLLTPRKPSLATPTPTPSLTPTPTPTPAEKA